MGVDAGIFAKQAQRYFWFDRLYNIRAYWDTDLSNEEHAFLEHVWCEIQRQDNRLTSEQILRFLKANIYAWNNAEESQRYHARNVQGMIEFINAHPGDHFFVSADDNDAYDLIGDMHGQKSIWTGKYSEWLPKKHEGPDQR